MKRLVFNYSDFIVSAEDFFYSVKYPLLVLFLTLLFWTTGWVFWGFLTFVLIGCFILINFEDLSLLISLLLSILFLPNDLSSFTNPLFYLVFAPAGVCLVYHFIKFKPRKIFLGKMVKPLIFIFLTMLLGGITSANASQNYSYGLPQILEIGAGMFVIYFVLSQGFLPKKDINAHDYFMRIVLCAGLVPVFELYLCAVLKINAVNETLNYDNFGWGDKNFIGYILLIIIPTACYFITRSKNILPSFALLFFLIFSTIFSRCDGAIGILVLSSPVLCFFTYKHLNKTNKNLFLCLSLLVLTIGGGIAVYKAFTEPSFLRYAYRRFLETDIRDFLYITAFNVFKEFPIFGGGVFLPAMKVYKNLVNYHSSFFHVIATTGILGLFAYVYLTVNRVRIFTAKNTPFNLFIFISYLLFFCYSSIDCGEFLIVVTFINVCSLAVEQMRYTDTLPLSKK